jgi:hypothetical protein
VIWGDYDFIPQSTAAHIAAAIPNARLITLTDCGHFSYLECPDAVRKEDERFLSSVEARDRRSVGVGRPAANHDFPTPGRSTIRPSSGSWTPILNGGDTTRAVESDERALNVDPNNLCVKEKLEKLRGPSGLER